MVGVALDDVEDEVDVVDVVVARARGVRRSVRTTRNCMLKMSVD